MFDFSLIQQPKKDRLQIKQEDKEEDEDVVDDDDDYRPHRPTRRSSRSVKRTNYREMEDNSEEPPETSKARFRTWKPIDEINDDDVTSLKPRRRGRPGAPRTAERFELEENIIELLKPSTRK